MKWCSAIVNIWWSSRAGPMQCARRPIFLALFLLLSACAHQQTSPQQPGADRETVKAALYAQYSEWQGVPYRLGGLSRQGIDCSGFVQITFQQRFQLQLPRITRDQAQQGVLVKPGERRAGDLMFFRMNRRRHHVGIYLEGDRFLHASTSKGVMISRLSNVYWTKYYWKTIRPSFVLGG